MRKKVEIIYPELSYKLMGLFFKTHNKLGRFCKEKQYADLLEIRLKKEKINYEREKEVPINDNGHEIKGNKVDFCVENKILIDLKAKRFILKDDYYQMKRYLRAAGCRLGFIVNFRDIYLKPKRILN